MGDQIAVPLPGACRFISVDIPIANVQVEHQVPFELKTWKV